MTSRRIHGIALALAAASFALPALLYDRLPERVPTHWDLHGRADGFTAKPWGAFLTPLVALGLWALFQALPRLSPRRFRIERFQRAYDLIALATVAFALALSVVATLAAAGAPVPMARALPVAAGALMVVIGNFLGKLTRNFFVGIRTPWTLASGEVWRRTHRLGGRLLVGAGLGAILIGLVAPASWTALALALILVVALVSVVYSYLLYRRLEGLRPDRDADHDDDEEDDVS